MKKIKAIVIILGIIFVIGFGLLPCASEAQVPKQINYQGILKNSAGNPVPNGTYQLTFSIYDSAGLLVWTEIHPSVAVNKGIFDVQIGQDALYNPLPEFDGDMSLGVKVNSDPEMSPRQVLTSVPFSIKAADSDNLEGHTASDFASQSHGHGWGELTGVPSDFVDGVDNTGIMTEADPTVLASVKDGVSWPEISARPSGLDDGDDVGILVELDPTIVSSVKDGVSWNEIDAVPAGFADGIDDTGITSETDPGIGNLTRLYIPTWNGSQLTDSSIYEVLVPAEGHRIGLGTSDPFGTFHVAGSSFIDGSLQVGTGDKQISLFTDGSMVDLMSVGSGLAINFVGDTDTVINVNGGRVGVGIGEPQYKLHVTEAGTSPTIYGKNEGTGHGIYGWSQYGSGSVGISYGLDADDYGLYGWNLGVNSIGCGVYGKHNSSGNFGRIGSEKYGVYGELNPAISSSDHVVAAVYGFIPGPYAYESFDGDYAGYFMNGAQGGTGVFVKGEATGLRVEALSTGIQTEARYDAAIFAYANTIYGDTPLAGGFYGEVQVTGDFTVNGGGTKNFAHPHPSDPSKQIVYTSLEGGENGVYVRGTGQLENGFAVVDLPEHFAMVTADIGLTAQVTPLDDCRGLFVTEKTPASILVKEAQGGSSSVRFDYLVMGVRRGFEDRPVIQENKSIKPLAQISQEEYEARLAQPKQKKYRDLLIENGTLTEEGKINLETADRLGWKLGPKTRAERLKQSGNVD